MSDKPKRVHYKDNFKGRMVIFKYAKNARGYPLTGEIVVHDDECAIVKAWGLLGPGSEDEINDVPLAELDIQVEPHLRSLAYLPTIGYVVTCSSRKRSKAYEVFDNDPLSYGDEMNEPSPGELLRRGRFTMFASQEKAEAALKKSLAKAKADGAEYPDKHSYRVIKVENKT